MTVERYDSAYFDALYAADPDPWNFRTSTYEKEKYAATIAAIDDRRYARALEVGCSIGELSARLAPLCGDFLGVDIAERALAAARERCSSLPQARFACRAVPADWPEGSFDLIILSEVLYFMSAEAIQVTATAARASLTRQGRILLVNWLGSTETPPPGHVAAEAFIAGSGLTLRKAARNTLYRLDLLEKEI